jgi:hypothetical protein
MINLKVARQGPCPQMMSPEGWRPSLNFPASLLQYFHTSKLFNILVGTGVV